MKYHISYRSTWIIETILETVSLQLVVARSREPYRPVVRNWGYLCQIHVPWSQTRDWSWYQITCQILMKWQHYSRVGEQRKKKTNRTTQKYPYFWKTIVSPCNTLVQPPTGMHHDKFQRDCDEQDKLLPFSWTDIGGFTFETLMISAGARWKTSQLSNEEKFA